MCLGDGMIRRETATAVFAVQCTLCQGACVVHPIVAECWRVRNKPGRV